jgi:hypothetical protein
MKAEAQGIAIAEACGYQLDSWEGKVKGIIGWKFKDQYISILPDYLNDLNAMHEAEKVLHGNCWRPYRDKLAILTNSGPFPDVDCTAAQRAEAFLRTLNLWTDEP